MHPYRETSLVEPPRPRKSSLREIAFVVVVQSALFAIFGAAHAGCGPVRNTLASITPTVPASASCVDGAARCAAGVPQSCRVADNVARWWPLTPLAIDGGAAACGEVCVVNGTPARAHCATADAGVSP